MTQRANDGTRFRACAQGTVRGLPGSRWMRRGVAGALVGALALGLSACSVADPAPRSQPVRTMTVTDDPIDSRAAVTFMVECDQDRRVSRPNSFVLACADANEALDRLVWRGWGDDQARATGEYVFKDCVPDCSKGKDVAVPVRVVADQLVEGEASATYRRLTVTSDDGSTERVQQVYHLPGIAPGEDAGAGGDPVHPADTHAPEPHGSEPQPTTP